MYIGQSLDIEEGGLAVGLALIIVILLFCYVSLYDMLRPR